MQSTSPSLYNRQPDMQWTRDGYPEPQAGMCRSAHGDFCTYSADGACHMMGLCTGWSIPHRVPSAFPHEQHDVFARLYAARHCRALDGEYVDSLDTHIYIACCSQATMSPHYPANGVFSSALRHPRHARQPCFACPTRISHTSAMHSAKTQEFITDIRRLLLCKHTSQLPYWATSQSQPSCHSCI